LPVGNVDIDYLMEGRLVRDRDSSTHISTFKLSQASLGSLNQVADWFHGGVYLPGWNDS
jgi:hypothetical protein